jgi:hypothetical protein
MLGTTMHIHDLLPIHIVQSITAVSMTRRTEMFKGNLLLTFG